MIQAATVCIHPREAMTLTIREIHLFAKGRNIANREVWRQKITVAHLTASLMRAKKIPELRRLLPREHKEMTPKQRQKAIWGMVRSMARPGEIVTGKRKKK